MKRFFIVSIILCSFCFPALADDVVCDFNTLTFQSPLLQQGFTDASNNILGNPTEARKARQVLANVQRVFLHPASQSILMYGWSDLPDALPRDSERNAFLVQRMQRLKKEAEAIGHRFDYEILIGKPVAVNFHITYRGQPWPQREEGVEAVVGDRCWLTIKLGGNKIADKNADAAFVDMIENEFSRMRSNLLPNNTFGEQADGDGWFGLHALPDLDLKNFWAFTLPTFLLAFLFGVIIGRAAKPLDNVHVTAYFRIMTALWVMYALLISLFKAVFITHGFTPNLEHYVYAAMMIAIHGLGILLGPVMALPSIALALGHSLRAALFLLVDYQVAPRMIWFDVGLMTLAVLYVLIFGFKRRSQLARPSAARPNVVDRP